jgi:glycosyltransferase involved in cell wall biosynthesis
MPLAVFAEYLHEAMGVQTLLAAWERVLAHWPEAKLWLIGEGPDGRRIWDRVRQLELENHVILPGSFDDLTDVLHAADLFVLPSHEGVTSTTLLRAVAAGVPVIASDTELHRSQIEHLRQGLLVSPQDAAALARSICDVLEAPQRAAQRAAVARQRIRIEHSIERTVRNYALLFDNLRRTRSCSAL